MLKIGISGIYLIGDSSENSLKLLAPKLPRGCKVNAQQEEIMTTAAIAKFADLIVSI
jgi:hypothetical protein